MKILEIESLVKTFSGKRVLDNMNLTVQNGIIFGLIGPNGAGKSTTINCISNLLDYDSGKIKIFDEELDESKIHIRKRLGFFFENTENLFVQLTGEEQLRFVGEVYGLDKTIIENRIQELLAFFDLGNHSQILIEKYSKGMKKKLGIASILLYNPDFIILDEPFDGLDTFTVIKVKKLIKLLREKGKTILITSHILSYIEDMADEIAIINKGKIIYQSATKDIRNKIKNELTKETYHSLEEVFLDLTTEKDSIEKKLSWL